MWGWLKSWWSEGRAYLRRKMREALALLEQVADSVEEHGGEFVEFIEELGPKIEAKVIEVQQVYEGLGGAEKLGKVIDWVRENHAELMPYTKELRTWISAVVALRKAALLFKS